MHRPLVNIHADFMPNQRKATKKNVSGYIDSSLKDKIKNTGLDETGFVEWSIILGLLVLDRITKAEIKKLAEDGRLRSSTVLMLKNEKLLNPMTHR